MRGVAVFRAFEGGSVLAGRCSPRLAGGCSAPTGSGVGFFVTSGAFDALMSRPLEGWLPARVVEICPGPDGDVQHDRLRERRVHPVNLFGRRARGGQVFACRGDHDSAEGE